VGSIPIARSTFLPPHEVFSSYQCLPAARCAKIEEDRRTFLGAMAKIKQEMVLGVDKNVYVEPTTWTVEWARNCYQYPVTLSLPRDRRRPPLASLARDSHARARG
jgi:hypothetical protein